MKPVIALVGRPNVGKSTLFNCLTRSRDALVANLPGLTRDRQYGEGVVEDQPFIVIDTGGITGSQQEGVERHMLDQSLAAVEDADIVLFLVDAKAGLTPSDEDIAAQLRKLNRTIQLVVNKIDRVDLEVANTEFCRLGFSDMHFIAAAHRRGVSQLITTLLEGMRLSEAQAEADQSNEAQSLPPVFDAEGVKIAIIGRPNVGKSTLVNRLLGEERVVVYDQPGTTRDSVYIPYEHNGEPYVLIDTAGVRRKGRVTETVEKFSVVKTLKAISDAHVAVLLVDAQEGVVDQDLHMLSYAVDAGRSIVIAVNKWDGLSQDQRKTVRYSLSRKLHFIDYVKIHFISALHGSGVGKLYGSIKNAYRSAKVSVSPNKLTGMLEGAIEQHQPPLCQGRRIKLRYAHLGGSFPPVILIHGNQTQKVPAAYTRYLENVFRKSLSLEGTPIKIEYKTGANPFEGKRNQLSQRQVNKRRRLMKHVKKMKR